MTCRCLPQRNPLSGIVPVPGTFSISTLSPLSEALWPAEAPYRTGPSGQMTPHRRDIDRLNGAMRQQVETVDGHIYFSDDDWQTVFGEAKK